MFANLSHVRFAAHTTTAKKAKIGGGGVKRKKKLLPFFFTKQHFHLASRVVKTQKFSVARATPTENKFEINLLLHISHSTFLAKYIRVIIYRKVQIVRHLKLKRKKKSFQLTCGG
jgi:hypothetical protein